MKIFISWSGDRAKDAAYLLRDWLPTVIQQLDTPWVSDVDIESGANWSQSIGAELSDAQFGIVCITRENQDRPWLNFEAGAISKLVGGAVPLLIDFDSPAQLTGGPMSQLQVRMPDSDGMTKMLTDLNKRLEKPLGQSVLVSAFGRAFGEFEKALQLVNARHDSTGETKVPDRQTDDKIDEMLNLVRNIASEMRTQSWKREAQLAGATQPLRAGMTSGVAMSGTGTLSTGGTSNQSRVMMQAQVEADLRAILAFYDLPRETLRIQDIDEASAKIEAVSTIEHGILKDVRSKLKGSLPNGIKVHFYENRSANPGSDIMYIIDEDRS